MDLEEFKSSWQVKMDPESDHFKHSPQELATMLGQVKYSIRKAHRKNIFWLLAILAGILLCLGGYVHFRVHYSPKLFPALNIKLYDFGFLVGMVAILFKLCLSTWWTFLFSTLNAESYDTPIKELLERLCKQFETMYQLSLWGSFLLLPMLLFLELRVLSPLLGWQLHHSWWQNALLALALALVCISIGHYLYRKTFIRDTAHIRDYLAQLSEPK